MIERDPEKFLSALRDALHKRLDADRFLKPQDLLFAASMSAVPVRLSALDSLAAKFLDASVNSSTDLNKRQEQNQILFDFFSNAVGLFESFYCGSYFVGAMLDPDAFGLGIPFNGILKQLRKIGPRSTLESYTKFADSSEFTKQLQHFLASKECKLIDMMRNLLVHCVVPGRTIPLSTHGDFPHCIDRDQWYEGDMTKIYGGVGLPEPGSTFQLDENCLARQRDWIENAIDGLVGELTALAKTNGLG